ncbi:unnamed protein product [Penicillium glandicola]
MFHQEINHFIYQPVRLRRVENARRFAHIVISRPDLAALVKEVRHVDDAGFADYSDYSEPFYQALSKLQNLQTLVMREGIRPDYKHTPQRALQEVLAEIYHESEHNYLSDSCLDDIIMDMEAQGYPLGDASDPLGLGFHPWEDEFSLQDWAQDLAEYTYFSRGYLKDLIPALRTCHLGTDSDLNPNRLPSVEFNETIFTLPHLQKLCITGARFRRFGLPHASIDDSAASLKELLLLNCLLSTDDLEFIIQFPRALERLTIRVPLSLETPYDEEEYELFCLELCARYSESLEYVDLDIYGGAYYGLSLDGLDVLKEVIITPHSMVENFREEMMLPVSVQKLTIRYEEHTSPALNPILQELENKYLPNLRSVVCQIPDNICEGITGSEARIEAEALKSKFQDLGVELSTEVVPYPLTMPKYDVCPCENMTFYHQFPFHTRAKPFPRQESV